MAKKTKPANNSTDLISSNQGVIAPKARQQINIRLSHDDGQRLTELKEYWASKGSISFLHKSESGDSVFDSNSTLARFIMETGLQYLHLDLINEKQIETIAKLATEINASIENIGARRLHTIIEKVLDEISFTATDRGGEKIIIDKNYVTKNLGELAKDTDLSKFIL